MLDSPTMDDPASPATTENDERATEGGGWRRIFEHELRALELDRRVQLAHVAEGETLFALCFDPAARVVSAVLENPNAGLDHARLLARHHRSSLGLDALAQRAAFLRDAQLQRDLLRNPQTSERLLQRLFLGQGMDQVYRLTLGHEMTDRVRSAARQTFRKAFTAGSAEERVALIVKTEGRCLGLLAGMALDAKTAALLCRRALGSHLLVRNLLQWSSTPPPVLAHLARQPIVLRNPELRNHLLRHPNTPSRFDVTG